MVTVKFKEATKFKSFGKCNLVRKRLCDDEIYSNQQRMDFKDYVNEVFAGLIWLG